MQSLPEDLQQIAAHEPRFVDVDQAPRSTAEGEQLWWRGLIDTMDCHDPGEIADGMKEKGLSRAEPEIEIVWLRPVEENDPGE